MLKCLVVVLGLLGGVATLAWGQEADPAKSGRSPWPLDQRCAIMAAHLYNQAGFPDQCVGGMWPGKIEIGAQRSVFGSEVQVQQRQDSRTYRRGGDSEKGPRL